MLFRHVIHLFLRYWYQYCQIHARKLSLWRCHLFHCVALENKQINKRVDNLMTEPFALSYDNDY